MEYYIYKSDNKVNSYVLNEGKKVKPSFTVAINTPVYLGVNVENTKEQFDEKINEIRKKLCNENLLGSVYDRSAYIEGKMDTQPFRISRESEYIYAINLQKHKDVINIVVLVGSYSNVTYGYAIERIDGMFEMKTKNLHWRENEFIKDIISICNLGIENRFNIEYLGECIYNNEFDCESGISNAFKNKDFRNKKVVLEVITPFYMRVIK